MTYRFASLATAGRAVLGLALALGQACAPEGEGPEGLASVEQAVVAPLTIVSPAAIPAVAGADFNYVEIANARCRDGSNAGVSVRRSSDPANKKVLVYLQGGGACFDTQTCYENPASIPVSHRVPQNSGIFSTNNGTNNPFYDWNVVYVPYCTGDFHMGAKISSVDLGPSKQYFYGRLNLELILKSAVATFPGTTQVVLSGSSAGGGGAVASATPVKRAFGVPNLWLLDDAGPFLSSGTNFSNDYLPGAEQTRWKNYWGLDSTILAECGAPCANNQNWATAFAKNTINVIGRKPALIIGKQDTTVALLYANARADQYGPAGFAGVEMRDALNDFRTHMAGTWSTYYVTNSGSEAQKHMRLVYDDFYSTHQTAVTGGQQVYLNTWVWSYIHDFSAPEVGP